MCETSGGEVGEVLSTVGASIAVLAPIAGGVMVVGAAVEMLVAIAVPLMIASTAFAVIMLALLTWMRVATSPKRLEAARAYVPAPALPLAMQKSLGQSQAALPAPRPVRPLHVTIGDPSCTSKASSSSSS